MDWTVTLEVWVGAKRIAATVGRNLDEMHSSLIARALTDPVNTG